MASRPTLRRTIITNDLSMPGLVDVVANIVRVWPLVVSCLKETGRKDNGDSLVVMSSVFGCFDLRFYGVTIGVLLFRRRGWTGICTWINLHVRNLGYSIFFSKPVSMTSNSITICVGHVKVPGQFQEKSEERTNIVLHLFLISLSTEFQASRQTVGDSQFSQNCGICSCFSCQHFRSIPECKWLRVAHFWGVGLLRLLPPREDLAKIFLPLVEQWDEYMLANHSKFPFIADEEFLCGLGQQD